MAEPTAMCLATASPDGVPSARMVLLKGIDDRGLTFFTSYRSRKGAELAANPHAAAVLHWQPLGRQLRVEGAVSQVDAGESDAYWESRERGSQLSASISPQSEAIASRAQLEAAVADLDRRLAGTAVPRPAWWGGYRLEPVAIEFWVKGVDRLHDRQRCTRAGGAGAGAGAAWRTERLGP